MVNIYKKLKNVPKKEKRGVNIEMTSIAAGTKRLKRIMSNYRQCAVTPFCASKHDGSYSPHTFLFPLIKQSSKLFLLFLCKYRSSCCDFWKFEPLMIVRSTTPIMYFLHKMESLQISYWSYNIYSFYYRSCLLYIINWLFNEVWIYWRAYYLKEFETIHQNITTWFYL